MRNGDARRILDRSAVDSLSCVEDEKDPFAEWRNKSYISSFAALINLLRAALAVGYMKMPYHFSLSGFLWPTVLVMLSVSLSLLAAHVLIRTLCNVAKDRGHEYICFPDVIKLIMDEGPNWSYRTSVYIRNGIVALIITSETLTVAVYVNVMSYKSVFFFGGSEILREIIEISLIAPLVIMCFSVWKMKYVTYISASGHLMLAVSLLIILYLVIADEDESTFKCQKVTETNVFQLPSLIGTSLFAVHNFGVFLIIHAHMKKPEDFLKPTGVLNQSYAIMFVFVLVAAFFSCYKFSSMADLPYVSDGDERKWRCILRIINSVIIFLSIPIHFQVCVEFTEHYFFHRLPEDYPLQLIKCIVRFFYIILIVIIALFVPQIAGFYPILGETVTSIGGIFLPALVELLYLLKSENRNWHFWRTIATDIFLMVAGIFYFCIGILVAAPLNSFKTNVLSEKELVINHY